MKACAGMAGCAEDPKLRCEGCAVRRFAFCAAMAWEDLAELDEIAEHVDVPAGGAVFQEGDQAVHVYNVTLGALKLFKLMPDGRQQMTGFLFPGDFLGFAATQFHANTAVALTDTGLCQFRRDKLRDTFDRFPLLERRLLALSNDEIAAAQEQMLLLGRKKAAERVATFLLHMADQQEARGGLQGMVALPMGRADIADYLGLTIETVSRCLARFRKQGLIGGPNPRQLILHQRETLSQVATGV